MLGEKSSYLCILSTEKWKMILLSYKEINVEKLYIREVCQNVNS